MGPGLHKRQAFASFVLRIPRPGSAGVAVSRQTHFRGDPGGPQWQDRSPSGRQFEPDGISLSNCLEGCYDPQSTSMRACSRHGRRPITRRERGLGGRRFYQTNPIWKNKPIFAAGAALVRHLPRSPGLEHDSFRQESGLACCLDPNNATNQKPKTGVADESSCRYGCAGRPRSDVMTNVKPILTAVERGDRDGRGQTAC